MLFPYDGRDVVHVSYGAQEFLVVGVALGKGIGERAEDEPFPAGRDVVAHGGKRGDLALRRSACQHKMTDGAHGEDVALNGRGALDLLRGNVGVVGIVGRPDGRKPDVGQADERPAGGSAAALNDHDAVRVYAAVGEISRAMRVCQSVSQLGKEVGYHVLFQKARRLVEIFLEVEAVVVVAAAYLLVGRVLLDGVEVAVADRAARQLRNYGRMVEAFPFPCYRLGRFRVAPGAVDLKSGQFFSFDVLGDEHAAGSSLAQKH